jgi:hypothetical protein
MNAMSNPFQAGEIHLRARGSREEAGDHIVRARGRKVEILDRDAVATREAGAAPPPSTPRGPNSCVESASICRSWPIEEPLDRSDA